MSDVGALELLRQHKNVRDGLSSQLELGEDSFNLRVDTLSSAFGYPREEIVAAFNQAVAEESCNLLRADIDQAFNGTTVPSSLIELVNRVAALAEQMSTKDNKVRYRVYLENDGERVVARYSLRGTGSSVGGGLDGFTAYERGCRAGDSFTITRRGPGLFRDNTRGEDIPKYGLVKWLKQYYPESQTVAILTKAGK